MKIFELRIFTPLSLEEFLRGDEYMFHKGAKEMSHDGQGVEWLLDEPWERDGSVGKHTMRRMYIEERVPKWVRKLFPPEAWIIEEESFSAGPYSKTTYKDLYMKDDFLLSCETIRVAGVSTLTNPLNLPPNEIKNCPVHVIDLSQPPPKGKEYDVGLDPTRWKSEKTNRGPLTQPGWWKAFHNRPHGTAAEEEQRRQEFDKMQKQFGKKPLPDETDAITKAPFAFSHPISDTECGLPEHLRYSTNKEQPYPMPVVTAHKVIKFHFKWWGLQTIMENYSVSLCQKIYTGTHKQITCWLDEYFDLDFTGIAQAAEEMDAAATAAATAEKKEIKYLDDGDESEAPK
ncbi:putative Phosphatidylinositol transfer protein alpha [Blattamonas nauphoetae]|uniref:Phosphatidylinositol transfer protein alpha n=1 Tax=Blattamonas nauphoetae TaxID=2049346 RepID=A0ABQ9X617_9EUKA|nr:putative Phosphatidylinositol transfer protein alpha [Blattamonas nauphoetae]